jgi:hypothetical protein
VVHLQREQQGLSSAPPTQAWSSLRLKQCDFLSHSDFRYHQDVSCAWDPTEEDEIGDLVL